jgi:hypothetical protein
VFDAVDPFNAANVEHYGRLLLDLQESKTASRSIAA